MHPKHLPSRGRWPTVCGTSNHPQVQTMLGEDQTLSAATANVELWKLWVGATIVVIAAVHVFLVWSCRREPPPPAFTYTIAYFKPSGAPDAMESLLLRMVLRDIVELFVATPGEVRNTRKAATAADDDDNVPAAIGKALAALRTRCDPDTTIEKANESLKEILRGWGYNVDNAREEDLGPLVNTPPEDVNTVGLCERADTSWAFIVTTRAGCKHIVAGALNPKCPRAANLPSLTLRTGGWGLQPKRQSRPWQAGPAGARSASRSPARH